MAETSTATDHRAPSGILITIDGEPVDLQGVSWIQIAPCGCTSAVTVAYSSYGAGPAHVVITPDQAAERFGTTAAERKQDIERGFTIKAIRRGDLNMADCQHNPKWGIVPRPTPDGMAWAVGGFYDERTRVQHLVPTESVRTDDHDPDRGNWRATSLCEVRKSMWTSRWPDTDGKVECKRCTAKAFALLAAVGA